MCQGSLHLSVTHRESNEYITTITCSNITLLIALLLADNQFRIKSKSLFRLSRIVQFVSGVVDSVFILFVNVILSVFSLCGCWVVEIV